MILNPIIRREVLSSLRTRKALAMQTLFLLVTAGLIWLYWPADGLQDLKGKQAENIFSILAIGQLLMMALFAPAFTASSLTGEKEHGTFESVYSTALRPWEIALGKMVGSLAFLLLLVLSGTPALAATLMLAGGGTKVIACVAVLLLTAVYMGMIGLLVSAFMNRSYRAVIVTYAILGVLVFVVALPAWPITRQVMKQVPPAIGGVLHVLASLSPLEAMLSLVWPDNAAYSRGLPTMPPFWQLYIPLSVLAVLGTAVMCLIKLHKPIAPPRPREKLQIIERDGKIRARDFIFLVDPRKRKRMIRWWQNPVLIKEFRTRPMLQAHRLIRAFLACLVVSVVLMLVVTFSFEAVVAESVRALPNLMMAVATLMVALIVLVGPAMSGGTICGDVETGVWDLLRTTRLSSWSIVSGKFQAAIIPMLLLILAITPALLIPLYVELELWRNVVRILEVVGMTALFVSVAGMFFSSLFMKTSTATAWTYALVITMALATLLVMLGQDRFSDRVVYWVFVLNPVAAVLDAAGYSTTQKFGLLAAHLKIIAAATAVMVIVTVVRVFQLRRVA